MNFVHLGWPLSGGKSAVVLCKLSLILVRFFLSRFFVMSAGQWYSGSSNSFFLSFSLWLWATVSSGDWVMVADASEYFLIFFYTGVLVFYWVFVWLLVQSLLIKRFPVVLW